MQLHFFENCGNTKICFYSATHDQACQAIHPKKISVSDTYDKYCTSAIASEHLMEF